MEIKVSIIPKRITKVKTNAEAMPPKKPEAVTKNIDINAIIAGNLPLQGTRLFVIIPRSLSLGESMIRQPITPAALQPKPIHIVRACFPQLLHLLKGLSRLKAILGKKPASSSRVKRGKNIAIGGSITDITHKGTFKTPFTIKSVNTFGSLI